MMLAPGAAKSGAKVESCVGPRLENVAIAGWIRPAASAAPAGAVPPLSVSSPLGSATSQSFAVAAIVLTCGAGPGAPMVWNRSPELPADTWIEGYPHAGFVASASKPRDCGSFLSMRTP
jgi:hypothetical protein